MAGLFGRLLLGIDNGQLIIDNFGGEGFVGGMGQADFCGYGKWDFHSDSGFW